MSYDNPNMAIIKAIREQHLTVTEAARKFKRSRQWIYQLLARYDHSGAEAYQGSHKRHGRTHDDFQCHR